eukprot:161202-Pyramimonas_sp.AAC.1
MAPGSLADARGSSLWWTTRATYVVKTTQLSTACCCLLCVGHIRGGSGGVVGLPTVQVEVA